MELNIIKNIISSVTLAIFQVFSSPVWLVATIVDNTDIVYFCYCRKFSWILSRGRRRKRDG